MVQWRGAACFCQQSNTKKAVRAVLQISVCIGALAIATQGHAQTTNSQFYQINHDDVAEKELLDRSIGATSLPTQSNMREVFWGFPETMPAFFRDSMVQVVAPTYDLTR